MKTIFRIKLILLICSILVLILFQACCDGVRIDCDKTSDCYEDGICIGGYCERDFCKEKDCVAGKCIQDTAGTRCVCGNNSLLYKKKLGGSMVCTLKCETHQDCLKIDSAFNVCIKGQCVEYNRCEQDSDCPEGEICDYNHCKEAPIAG